jgi:putative heme iron utilization protein
VSEPVSGSGRPGVAARQLIRTQDKGSLATLLAGDGTPYASLVLYATLPDATPVLLLSALAEHTKNLITDPRASLLIDGTAGLDDPLTGARVTLAGRIEALDDPRASARYLARHPSAARYVGFGDFRFYGLRAACAHLVAGFGRIHWIEAADLLDAPAETLAAREADIVAHMNDDHGEALDLYAGRLLGRAGTGWRMTGIDPEGCDLRRANETARLDFPTRVADADAARRELVRLANQARGHTPT